MCVKALRDLPSNAGAEILPAVYSICTWPKTLCWNGKTTLMLTCKILLLLNSKFLWGESAPFIMISCNRMIWSGWLLMILSLIQTSCESIKPLCINIFLTIYSTLMSTCTSFRYQLWKSIFFCCIEYWGYLHAWPARGGSFTHVRHELRPRVGISVCMALGGSSSVEHIQKRLWAE